MRRFKWLGAGVALGVLLMVTGCGSPIAQLNNPISNSPISNTIKKVQESLNKTQILSNNQTSPSEKSTNAQTTVNPAATSANTQESSTGSSLGGSTKHTASSDEVSQIKQHLQNQEQKFTVPISSSEKVGDVFKEALNQDPYIHWIVSSYDISSDGVVASFNVNYRETKQQTDAVESESQHILNSILKPGMTNVYKEFVIHNWIVSHLQYDTSLQVDTPYEALKTGSAVCQGYALLAYRMLMDAGIPTKIESGQAGGESHMWNEVFINGHWYQLDPTWDDPVGDQPNDELNTYFNLTNQELAHSHQWNQNEFPIAQTDFSTQLKSLVQSDPKHAAQYETILSAIGANLPIEKTTESAHQLIQQAIQEKKSSIDFIIQSTQAHASSFMSQAVRHLVSSSSVSFQYSTPTYVRKGQDYCRVHLTFSY